MDNHKCAIIGTLCLINFTANSAYSSIAPFYPREAKIKGVPDEYVGFIFSGYSISMTVLSPLFGSLLTKYGRKNMLIVGCICESLAMIAFGMFYYVNGAVSYGVLSFVSRVIEGFGNGCLNSASFSIIAYCYEDSMSKLIGIVQTFTGLGMLAGPLLGSFLY